ncbi:MAG: Cof-type HAD-IIB family hydrolase [Clostridia bacterium]|nr:Cof-type HAD-IIB family hydrolase [Clostridia bacterium]
MRNKLEKGKYIIFLDIDGTVFDGKTVPEKNKAALAKARAAGHKVFLNTGRAHCIVTKEILKAVKPDGVISAMGTAIFVGDELIYSAVMDEAEVQYLLGFGDERDMFVIVESIERLVSLKGPAFLGQDNLIESAHELRVNYPDMNVSKISLMRHLTDEEKATLGERFPIVYVHENYAEISAAGHNKATGIERVCEYYGTDVAHTIAMGDSGNDDEMIKFAGIGVAMGNATEEIKAVADYITLPCEDGGVAHTIEKFLF